MAIDSLTLDDLAEEPSSDLLCCICKELLRNPMGCRQGHAFCANCINNHFLQGKKKTCPVDNKYLSRGTLTDMSRLNNIILNYVRVKCVHHSKIPSWGGARRERSGCGWTGLVKEREAHRGTCSFEEVPCSLRGCSRSVPRAGLDEHLATCAYRRVRCSHCREDVRFNSMNSHLERCKKLPMRCTCGFMTDRESIKDHRENVCPKTKLTCPFQEHGCEAGEMRRSHYEKHQVDHAKDHAEMTAKALSTVRKEHFELSDIVADLRRLVKKNTKSIPEEPPSSPSSSTSHSFTLDARITGYKQQRIISELGGCKPFLGSYDEGEWDKSFAVKIFLHLKKEGATSVNINIWGTGGWDCDRWDMRGSISFHTPNINGRLLSEEYVHKELSRSGMHCWDLTTKHDDFDIKRDQIEVTLSMKLSPVPN